MLLSTSSLTNYFQRKHKTCLSVPFIWRRVKPTSPSPVVPSLPGFRQGWSKFIHCFSAEAVPLCRKKNKTEREKRVNNWECNSQPRNTPPCLGRVHILLLYFIHGFFSTKMHKQSLGQGALPMGGTTSDYWRTSLHSLCLLFPRLLNLVLFLQLLSLHGILCAEINMACLQHEPDKSYEIKITCPWANLLFLISMC